ncbi:hypothetical protein [Telluria aromaticivorans]|uniref:Uncharacterized protein n=1 Tax=Telluria aromaticivorans TaxID=2725995 RepID=A0A7Y2K034_9BURK|nr:hypothetical protein [Telluria aromaticivorans]NNG24195.1 hypothetical protein [Telluria aromaticivorans]
MSTEDQPVQAPTTPQMSERGAARRRLTKAGLGAAGVLLSLESRATMKPMVCFSPSAGYSGKLSSNYNRNVVCGGKSPGYWKNHSGWPCSRGKEFDSVFTCSGRNQSTYGSKTMLQIVQGCDFDKYNLGRHLIATYLNVLSGRISFLSVKTLTDMWTQLQNTGFYKPSANVFWNAEQTKVYLEATHD